MVLLRLTPVRMAHDRLWAIPLEEPTSVSRYRGSLDNDSAGGTLLHWQEHEHGREDWSGNIERTGEGQPGAWKLVPCDLASRNQQK